MKNVFLFLAEGFEEIEAVATIDVLLRGGVDVKVISITDQKEVKGAHGLGVVADGVLKEALNEEAEMLIFPGGMPGAQNLADCAPLMAKLDTHFKQNGLVAAICAAPALVLSRLPLAPHTRITCYPGFESHLSKINVVADGVVVEGNVISAKGPAFACDFGLAIVEKLMGKAVADEVAAGMLIK
ncbi:DJ-1/PfpI family protein [Odoribacter sp. OttesenSCG-928-J03]|nr:DJ-1/PfpI family protein [Odoribacter sp. OttesenSCG-928-J03]MDL2283250.1 DJ-1/PfpI family protein [Odoribacter sp. OttesenSCG-928-G04]MDL2330583.1 DJ-1/PfpI family protein [Odoribacter sp. OttesenSCG-928-A06]